jgi:EAP30/Vps36 family
VLTAKLSTGDKDGDALAFEQDLQDMGISQPVTRQSSGKYEEELAKELSQFLDTFSLKTGYSQIPLSDAFCVFNRARGVGNEI